MAPPTPAALLSGLYTPAERVEYFPRRAQYCGSPCLSIAFARCPYLKDVLKDRVHLEGANDAVMGEQGWSRTRWVLEVRFPCPRHGVE
jgi:hypothetical protein